MLNILRRKNPMDNSLALKILSFTIVIFALVIVLLPIIFLFLYSILPSGKIGAFTGFGDLFSHATLEGYTTVFEQTPFLKMGMNSLWLSVVQTVLQLIVAFFTAYAITRWHYPKRDLIFNFIIATMIIPTVAVMIPNYIMINNMGLVNDRWGVVLPFVASGYAIFLMRQFFRSIPKSLVEAAMIDGCSELTILARIYLPLTLPAISALAIILFVTNWNDYQWPLMVLNDVESMTLPLALVRFRNEGIIEWMPTAAACVMTMIVPLLLYLSAQRSFVETFADSAVKG